MAQNLFNLRQHSAGPIVRPAGFAGGVVDLFSAQYTNNNALPCLRLVVDYTGITPVDIVGGIGVVVEVLNGGVWMIVAYQYEPYRNAENGNQRIILVQPNMNTYNDGIDSVVYTGNRTVARISRHQGRIGNTFRVRVELSEEPSTPEEYKFQSVNLAVYGDLNDDY